MKEPKEITDELTEKERELVDEVTNYCAAQLLTLMQTINAKHYIKSQHKNENTGNTYKLTFVKVES